MLIHYIPLQEPKLSKTLEKLCKAGSYMLRTGHRVDKVYFQPCQEETARSQDRYIIQDWRLKDGLWTFLGIYDGHLGHDTAEYLSRNLHNAIKQAIESHGYDSSMPDANVISALLQSVIKTFDDNLGRDVLALFPDGLEDMSDSDIAVTLQSASNGVANMDVVLRCMRGTTAVVSLLSPGHKHFWVANLGDSQAVLANRSVGETTWRVEMLARDHNLDTNVDEANRLRAEHPNEVGLLKDDRVIGLLSPTRTIGDWHMKFPIAFVARMLPHFNLGYRKPEHVETLLEHCRTPPYISADAEVVHMELGSLPPVSERFSNHGK